MGSGMRRFGAVFVSAALIAVACSGCGRRDKGSFRPPEGPVIAVLCQMSREVVLLAPDDLSVLARVPLRSQSLDMDAGGRTIVTAQSGGHDEEAGREFGRIDLSNGRVSYTGLKGRDIQTVGVAEGGWLMLTTGLIGQDGQFVHRVSRDGAIEDLTLEPGVGGCVGTRERVWVWRYWNDEAATPDDTYFVYGPTGAPVEVSSEMSMTVTLCGFADEVVAFGTDGTHARFAFYKAEDARLLRVGEVGGFASGPVYAWAAGRYIAVADGPPGDYYRATHLVFVDRESLTVAGTLDVAGVSAVAQGPADSLLVCQGDGSVMMLDGVTFEERSTARIGDPRGDLVDVEYVP